MQVWQKDRNQSIQLVEYQLQHRQLSVEQLAHTKLVDDISQDSEAKGFIFENKIQKSRDEVHALAVVQLWVDYCVGSQDASQVFTSYALHSCEASVDVYVNRVFYV